MRQRSREQGTGVWQLTRWVWLAVLVSWSLTGCFEDGVTLPDGYNTLKYREIVIQFNQAAAEPYGTVRPYSGVHGSPLPSVPGDADLTSLYWARNGCDPAQDPNCPPDGAHLTMVRVGTDTLCELSMETVFANAEADETKLDNYDFDTLDDHMEAIRGIGGQANILWQFGLNPGATACETSTDGKGLQLGRALPICGDGECLNGENSVSCAADCSSQCGDDACNGGENAETCEEDCAGCGDGSCSGDETTVTCHTDCDTAYGDDACNGSESATTSPEDCRTRLDADWPLVAVHTLRHLNATDDWDPNAKNFNVRYVEFMDDPHERLGYTESSNFSALFDSYQDFANQIKNWWPDDVDPDDPQLKDPQINVGGISYTIEDVSELEFISEAEKHPILRFIDYVAAESSATCASDCGSVCGDGVCNGNEVTANCAEDCGATCGDEDAVCDSDEDATRCPEDCGSACGDGVCTGNENATSPLSPGFCYADCGPKCGSGTCGVPLDFLSFRTRTVHPHDAACIAARLRGYLDDRGLTQTQLVLTNVEAVVETSTDSELAQDPYGTSTHLGAFHAATRIFLQSPLEKGCAYNSDAAPADWMIAGRIPRVYADLKRHVGEDPVPLESMLIESPFVEADGTAKPAFMSLFPFRQIANGTYQMVPVTQGNDTQGMAVLASYPSTSGRKLHVIIANANIQEGNADITYDLRLEGFVSTAKTVEYKLAVLDRSAIGHESFNFSDTGTIETGTGTVRFVHQMAVPSVHYIEFIKP